jgi:hypothetical protein
MFLGKDRWLEFQVGHRSSIPLPLVLGVNGALNPVQLGQQSGADRQGIFAVLGD